MSQSNEVEFESSGRSMAQRRAFFQDVRHPHQVQHSFEHAIMVVFSPVLDDGKLTFHGSAKVVGADYRFRLTFEAAEAEQNYYSLRIEAFWDARNVANHEYYQKTFGSWCNHWLRDLRAIDSLEHIVNHESLYRDRCEQTRKAEELLSSIDSIQQTILEAMKQGAKFATSHKEGGTHIYWNHGNFIRSDYGDDPASEKYRNEQEFLAKLFQFFQWEVTRNAPQSPVSEIEAWRLILRLMRS